VRQLCEAGIDDVGRDGIGPAIACEVLLGRRRPPPLKKPHSAVADAILIRQRSRSFQAAASGDDVVTLHWQQTAI
jgi:hypothetical protein